MGYLRTLRRTLVPIAGITCGIGWPVTSSSAEASSVADALRSTLPKYDPTIRAKQLAAEPTPPPPKNVPAEIPAKSDTSPDVVTLPRITVRPIEPTSEPTVALPRIIVRPPANDLKEEPFLTPAARDARLVKKHLSTFDRMLLNRFKIPFMGQSNVSRARDAEAVEHSAKQLDVIADLIQSKTSEPRDPEEQKKLKELYLETFMARPK